MSPTHETLVYICCFTGKLQFKEREGVNWGRVSIVRHGFKVVPSAPRGPREPPVDLGQKSFLNCLFVKLKVGDIYNFIINNFQRGRSFQPLMTLYIPVVWVFEISQNPFRVSWGRLRSFGGTLKISQISIFGSNTQKQGHYYCPKE